MNFFLTFHPCCGLCNRLFSLAEGYALSQYMPCEFHVCWHPSPGSNYPIDKILTLPKEWIVDRSIPTNAVVCGHNSGTWDKLKQEMEKHTSAIVLKSECGIFSDSSITINGMKLRDRTKEIIKNFVFNPDIVKDTEQFNVDYDNTIGVQVRRPNQCFAESTDEGFIAKTVEMGKKYNTNKVLLISQKHCFIKNIHDQLIKNNFSVIIPEKPELERNDMMEGYYAARDLIMLTKIKYLIRNKGSTFGIFACLYGHHERAIEC